jgi:hypothetical protein
MASNDKRNIMTAEEVQRAVNGGTPGQMNGTWDVPNNAGGTAPYGNPAITPVTGGGTTPASAAWRDVQATGKASTDYQALLKAQPGSYQSRYGAQMDQTLNQLLGQKPFEYDINTDALYQQIKDDYIKRGRRAMMDTQGQSAALTDGFGNSYAAGAGQQAFQDSLGSLADVALQTYDRDFQRNDAEDKRRRDTLALLQGLDESEYQRYQYDTQQYEAKLADAYQKFKASQGGGSGRKRTDPRTDAEWFYNYSLENGLEPDAAIDATSKQMGWTPEYTEAVRTITHGLTDYQKEQRLIDHINGGGTGA